MLNIENMKRYRNVSGIYYILDRTTGTVYVGSSIDIYRRLKVHYNSLLKNLHSNSYLQNTWNKRKEEDFLLGVLSSSIEDDLLLIHEQHWIDFFDSSDRDKGFNLSPTAGSNLGFKKTKEQINNNVKALQGAHKTILSAEEASKVKELLNKKISMTEIARLFKVEYETIRSIRRGLSFKYIDPQIDHSMMRDRKLSEEDVILIKKKLNQGVRVRILADDYGVNHRTISAIKNEITWKNVGEPITIKKRKARRAKE